jgi:hypothetical protein
MSQLEPSQHPNLRWFSQGLPDFLKSTAPYGDYPVLSDLAELEKALNDAFDSVDAPVLAAEELAGFAPEVWNHLAFQAHPTSRRIDVPTNVAAIWLALKNDEAPPDAVVLEQPGPLLVWRLPRTRRRRGKDVRWGGRRHSVWRSLLLLVTYNDPDGAAARGAGRRQFYRMHDLGQGWPTSCAGRLRDFADRRRIQRGWISSADEYRPHPGRRIAEGVETR